MSEHEVMPLEADYNRLVDFVRDLSEYECYVMCACQENAMELLHSIGQPCKRESCKRCREDRGGG